MVPITMKGLSECMKFGDLEDMYLVFTIMHIWRETLEQLGKGRLISFLIRIFLGGRKLLVSDKCLEPSEKCVL